MEKLTDEEKGELLAEGAITNLAEELAAYSAIPFENHLEFLLDFIENDMEEEELEGENFKDLE